MNFSRVTSNPLIGGTGSAGKLNSTNANVVSVVIYSECVYSHL